MRVLHTADWHLGDCLNYTPRTADIQRNVERVATYCQEREVDVLLVAGDLFSEQVRPSDLRELLDCLRQTFGPFLQRGGTILALTGNHDSETYCDILRHGFDLAAPAPAPGTCAPPGRLYLATEPQTVLLADRAERAVQFVLMPYPTPRRYLTPGDRPRGKEERSRALREAFIGRLRALRGEPAFDARLPSVLAAHGTVRGSTADLFRITPAQDIVLEADDIAGDWAYVALGHIHRPQALAGMPHARYAGSIERLDLGEIKDEKSIVLLDFGPQGLVGPPQLLPLEATPFLDVEFNNLGEDLSELANGFPDARRALVRCRATYRPGVDDPQALQQAVREAFPNCYHFELHPVDSPLVHPPLPSTDGLDAHATVAAYLEAAVEDETERQELLQLLDELFAEPDEAVRRRGRPRSSPVAQLTHYERTDT